MSNANFYFSKGYTPMTFHKAISGLNTLQIVDPGAARRLVVTSLHINCNTAGTIAFYFGGRTQVADANGLVAMYYRPASAVVQPQIGCWEGTAVGSALYAKLGGASGTDGCYVNGEGFYID